MQKVKNKNIVKCYGTPCNIYKDERILNYDYNHGLKEALYDVILMDDFRSKRHFGPKPPDYVMNKLTKHRVLELFCKRV